MITLNLTRGKDLEGIYIRLPAPQEKIEEAIARLDVISEDTATTRILNVSSSVKNLGDYIQNTDLSQPDGLQKVAALAEKLQPLDLESCLKFEGMLDANMVQGVDDVMKLADCLDEYVLLPEVGTGSALGRYLVNQGAFECPDHLRPYLDYQATIDEEVLKEAILSAVNQMMSSRDELTGQLIDAMRQELLPIPGQGLSISDIDRALENLSKQFDQLLKEASLSADSTENAERFRSISTAMAELKERRAQMEKLHHENEQVYRRVKAAEATLSETASWITEWKEDVLYQLLEKVTVLDETRIRVTFRSGVEIEQVLEKVERSVTA